MISEIEVDANFDHIDLFIVKYINVIFLLSTSKFLIILHNFFVSNKTLIMLTVKSKTLNM